MAENNKANSENKGFVDGLKAEFRKIVWPTQKCLRSRPLRSLQFPLCWARSLPLLTGLSGWD